MSKYFTVEPEVAGNWAEKSVYTRVPEKGCLIHKLHYVFEGWIGSELLEATPIFIVTERLAREIEHAALTGASFDDVEISTSYQFEEVHPGLELPKFVWLKLGGVPGRDDFAITPEILSSPSARSNSCSGSGSRRWQRSRRSRPKTGECTPRPEMPAPAFKPRTLNASMLLPR